jgi:beta-glucanase (GH16 family)
MKSILKTFNAGSISNFALIGMLSVLVSACGSEDSTNPRAYDTTGPEIIMAGDANIELDIGDSYIDAGATARDVWDGDTIVDQDATTAGTQGVATSGVDSVDTSTVGIYQVIYTAEDSSGNVSTAIRTIDVADRTGPVISIPGANPLLVPLNGTFDLPDATFVDAFDADQGDAATTDISSSGTVNSNVLGTYTVTYTATDNTGNSTTANLTVVVEPDYGDEVVIFRNGTITSAWQPGLNGYDQDLSWGACPAGDCPNLEFGFVNDAEKGSDVIYVSHADTEAQAGFFIETGTPNDLRGAVVNGKLQFDIWSESGVTVNVSADCMYPCQGGPVLFENVGVGEWQTIAIPASQMMTQGLNATSMKNVSTFSIFADGWRDATFRIDNISWLCEFTCTGTDQPDRVYTPWDRADKTVGYDAPTSYEGYDLVWHDEFDGTEVDASKWELINQGGGFGNFELQYYREENASVEDGLLVIEADIQKNDDEDLPGNELYSSAKLISQDIFEFKHGRVDIRAVVAEGKGMWSAGWMLGSNVDDIGWPYSGEVDIFDTIGGQLNGNPQEGMIVHNAYWNTFGPDFDGIEVPRAGGYDESYYNQSAWGERRINATNEGVTFSNQFHVFSIEWDEDKIRFFVDGDYVEGKDLALSGGVPCAGGSGLSCVGETYDQDFFLILNVAVGGDWPGAPDETTQFPRGMLVDYVRVYQTPAQQAAQAAQ